MKDNKTQKKPAVASSMHKLRTNALRALKIDPYNKQVLKLVISSKKVPASRANIVALAKTQPEKQAA